jgi:hypothetical protein
MLINNINELKEHIPASVTLAFDDIKPKIRMVEREIIRKIFSPELYTRLTKSEGATDHDEELRLILSEAVAHLALMNYLAFGQVNIDSSGVHIASTENMKTAFEWQINELKNQCSLQGWQAVESGLEYLDSLKEGDVYELWKATDTFAQAKANLLPSLRAFEKYTSLHHSRVMYNKLVPTLTEQQDEVIIPSLGKPLWDAMLTIPEESTRKDVLNKARTLTGRTLAFLTMARGFEDTLLILSDNGPLIIEGLQSRTTDAKLSAPPEVVNAMAMRYDAKAKGSMTELLAFLQANVDVLTEYRESPNFISDADQTNHIPRNSPDWGMVFL